METLQITVTEPIKGTAVVELRGEIDVITSLRFKERINELAERDLTRIWIDINRVGYIDSTGLVALIHAIKRARDRKRELKFFPFTDLKVLKTFNVTGLITVFEQLSNDELLELNSATEQ